MAHNLKTIFSKIFFSATGVMALVAVIIGLFGVIQTETSLQIVGIMLGLYLLIAGILRIVFATKSIETVLAIRILVGILGVAAIVSGGLSLYASINALINPGTNFPELVIYVSVGLMAEGLSHIVVFFITKNESNKKQWEKLLIGVVFFFGGLSLILLGNVGFATLFWWVCLVLLVVGAITIIWIIANTQNSDKAQQESLTE